MSTAQIMVIDDEKIVLDMLRVHLMREGYAVETFLEAAPALARLREQPFDVVVTDLKMKGLDGMEVLRTIKRDHAGTQVIMITAFAQLNTVMEAFRGEVFEFFPKPFKITDLVAAIRRALGGEPGGQNRSADED